MDSQKVEAVLNEILDRYGVYILRDRKRFTSALSDMLNTDSYRDERIVLLHALDSTALWILLSIPVITDADAERAVKQLEKESHLSRGDAEFVVRCAVVAAGADPETVMPAVPPQVPDTTRADTSWMNTGPVYTRQINIGTGQPHMNQANRSWTNSGQAGANLTDSQTGPGQASSNLANVSPTGAGQAGANRTDSQTDSGQADANRTDSQTDSGQAGASLTDSQTDSGQADANLADSQTDSGQADANLADSQTDSGQADASQTNISPTGAGQAAAPAGSPAPWILEASCKFGIRRSILRPRGKLCLWNDRMEFHPKNPNKPTIQILYQDISELWTRTVLKWLSIAFILELLTLYGLLYGLQSGTWSEIIAAVSIAILSIVFLLWTCGRNLGIDFPSGNGFRIWFYDQSMKKEAISLIRSEIGRKPSKKINKSVYAGILCMVILTAAILIGFFYLSQREDMNRHIDPYHPENTSPAEDVDDITDSSLLPEEMNEDDTLDDTIKLGNTTGNISNGGRAVKSGNWIYYLDQSGFGWLSKCQITGSHYEGEPLVKDSCFYINVLDDWIYFCDSKGRICQIPIDGTEEDLEVLADGNFCSLIVTDRAIYAVNTAPFESQAEPQDPDVGEIWCIEEDAARSITDCYHSAGMALDEEWIYFADTDSHSLCKIRPDGSGLACLDEGTASNIQVWNGRIYYIADDVIYSILPDGTGLETLFHADGLGPGVTIRKMNVQDDWVYIVCSVYTENTGEAPPTIWRVKPDTGESEFLADGISLNISDDELFYENTSRVAEGSRYLFYQYHMNLADKTSSAVPPLCTAQDFKENGMLWQDVMELHGAQWNDLFYDYPLTPEEMGQLFSDVQQYSARTGFESHGIPWEAVRDMLQTNLVPWEAIFEVYGISISDSSDPQESQIY